MTDNFIPQDSKLQALGVGTGETGEQIDELAADLINGGQLGLGIKSMYFDAATPLAFNPAVIVVLQTPGMWDNLDDDHVLRETVKAMFECHAKSVTGIDINYTLETQDQPVGHDGQTFKVPTQTKRAEVTPSFTWPEVTGNLVWNIMLRWIWDVSDPDTNAGLERMGDEPLSYTMSAYALTFMAIQFDPTMHPDRIIDAAVYTNVFPQMTSELGMQREIGTTAVKERAITFNGYVIHNRMTRVLGKRVAQSLSLRGEEYWNDAKPNVSTVNDLQFGDVESGPGIAQDKGTVTGAPDETNAVNAYGGQQ